MRRHSKMQIEIFWNSRKPDAVRSERGKAESSSEEGGDAGAKARHLILALTQRTPPLAHGYRADSSHVMTLSGSVRRSGMAANPRMVQRFPPARKAGSIPYGPPVERRRGGRRGRRGGRKSMGGSVGSCLSRRAGERAGLSPSRSPLTWKKTRTARAAPDSPPPPPWPPPPMAPSSRSPSPGRSDGRGRVRPSPLPPSPPSPSPTGGGIRGAPSLHSHGDFGDGGATKAGCGATTAAQKEEGGCLVRRRWRRIYDFFIFCSVCVAGEVGMWANSYIV